MKRERSSKMVHGSQPLSSSDYIWETASDYNPYLTSKNKVSYCHYIYSLLVCVIGVWVSLKSHKSASEHQMGLQHKVRVPWAIFFSQKLNWLFFVVFQERHQSFMAGGYCDGGSNGSSWWWTKCHYPSLHQTFQHHYHQLIWSGNNEKYLFPHYWLEVFSGIWGISQALLKGRWI